MTKYYIENLGDSMLDERLTLLASEGNNKITEHRQMECRDRAGNFVKKNLYEIPADVKDKLVRMVKADPGLFQFALYREVAENAPREFYTTLLRRPGHKFKRPQIGRRKRLLRLPHGVFGGSRLTIPFQKG